MAWKNISKPSDSTYTKVQKPVYGGQAGLFDYGQFDIARFDDTDDYIKVVKPSDTNYTKITKTTL